LNPSDDRAVAEASSRNRGKRTIIVVGESHSVPSYMRAADVLLVTSTREGLPSVVLEALAIGTPVVATRLPGMEWIQSHTVGVELCSLNADDGEWVEAIGRALQIDRRTIATAFTSSPFIMARASASFRHMWQIPPAADEQVNCDGLIDRTEIDANDGGSENGT
ncbi:MAG TPA: glycosyltransferase, partial [Nitrospira sp.]|nr:glycosyltransferase [Nitrospira sp.]